MSKTLIFSSTYNERDNIKELIVKINEYSGNLDILIVDDNSPDKTGEVLKELKKNYKNLNYIFREKKLGLDSAHKLAYEYALEQKYRFFSYGDAMLLKRKK